jgi:hypothetical protein
VIGRTEALIEGGYRRRRIMALGEIFASLKQGNILDGLFALVNG